MHPHSHNDETVRHAVDTGVIWGGSLTGIAGVFTEIINPLFTGLVLISTFIYTIMRIVKNRKKDD